MKKIISLILCTLMIVPLICITSYADVVSSPTGDVGAGYCYQWDDTTGAYFYADFAQTPARWEFDFMPLRYNSEVRSYMGNEFTMNAARGTIGIGNEVVRFQWTPGQWYNIVVDSTDGKKTVLEVNGTVVNTFLTQIWAQACCGMVYVAVDNLKCSNGYSQDFDSVSPFRPDIGVHDANGKIVYGSGHKHNYTSEIITSPSCTQYGKELLTCKYCGNKDTKNVIPLGHDWTLTETTAPTYLAAGSKVYDCTRCDETKSEEIAKLIIGDANNDGEITIKDSKLFKKNILDGTFNEALDLDFDGEITIKDSKLLKKLLLADN